MSIFTHYKGPRCSNFLYGVVTYVFLDFSDLYSQIFETEHCQLTSKHTTKIDQAGSEVALFVFKGRRQKTLDGNVKR